MWSMFSFFDLEERECLVVIICYVREYLFQVLNLSVIVYIYDYTGEKINLITIFYINEIDLL